MNKTELRKIIYSSLKDLSMAYKSTADTHIHSKLCSLPEYINADTVFCFVGIRDEISTDAMIDSMLSDGKNVCVPLCTEPGIMTAHQIKSRDELTEGKYGIPEPSADAPLIQPEDIDFAIIPCVTCNKKGQRLGHGGGYYDRYFEDLDTPAAIICREDTMTVAIPSDAHDKAFPIVVSERNIYRND